MESRTRVGLILNLTSKQDFKIDRYFIFVLEDEEEEEEEAM